MKIKVKKQVSGAEFVYNGPFPEFAQPSFVKTLRFPDDLTKLDGQNISELHGKYTQLYTYANQELCRINVRLIELQTKESLVQSAMIHERNGLNQIERWKRDAIIDSDPRMIAVKAEIARAKKEKEYNAMYLANFDRYLIALSRELSRKGQEYRSPG